LKKYGLHLLQTLRVPNLVNSAVTRGGIRSIGHGRKLKNSKNPIQKGAKIFFKGAPFFTGAQKSCFGPGRRTPLLRHCLLISEPFQQYIICYTFDVVSYLYKQETKILSSAKLTWNDSNDIFSFYVFQTPIFKIKNFAQIDKLDQPEDKIEVWVT